jgi:plasmid maintenance system antidote protein VapI
MTTDNFDHDWTISPGETLRDWMEENGLVLGTRLLTKVAATACGHMDERQFRGILDGKRKITNVAACRLQQGTGIPARVWLNLERAFRQGLAEGKHWDRSHLDNAR